MADRIRLLNRPLPETPRHVGHFPDNSTGLIAHHRTPDNERKENQRSAMNPIQSSSGDHQDHNVLTGNLWKAYLYELQLKAPTPKRVVASKTVVNKPPHYGREFHGVLSREEAERILINHSSNHSPSNTNRTTNSNGTASSDGSFDRWHHGHGHGTGSSGGQSTNRSDSGFDPDTGRYLVRESDRTRGQFTLSLRFNKVTKNFKLFYDGHKHFVGEKRFDTVHDLVADSLITLYLELHAADYIASLGNQQKYEESPYMTLHRRHRDVKLKKGHRSHKSKGSSVVSSPGHFQLTQHQVVHPQAVKASGGHRAINDDRVDLPTNYGQELPLDFNVNKRHGKFQSEAVRIPNDAAEDDDIVDGLLIRNEMQLRDGRIRNGAAAKTSSPEKKKDAKKLEKSKKHNKKRDEKDDGTERSSSVLGACDEEVRAVESDNDEIIIEGANSDKDLSVVEQMINVQLFEKVHSFKSHNFIGLPFCDYCANFMWGIIGQGVKCEG